MNIRPVSAPRGAAAPRRALGFTLVELMVGITIGLLLITVVFTALFSSAATGRTRDRAAEMQLNGRFALEYIKRDLQHAGFLGVTSLFYPDAPTSIAVASVCDPMTIGRVSQRIWGANDSNPYAGTCIPGDAYLHGDILVVRRLATHNLPTFNINTIYYRSAYEGGQFFRGPTPPDFANSGRLPPYTDYVLEENVYYVSPYTHEPNESPRIPALYRVRLGPGPAMTRELVASGVEHMQLRYAQVTPGAGAQHLDAAAVTDWDQVNAVSIWLLVRDTAIEPGYANKTTYTLGDRTIEANDSYRRLVFSSVVQLRN
jgi:type IV pilus assembly protein PilW